MTPDYSSTIRKALSEITAWEEQAAAARYLVQRFHYELLQETGKADEYTALEVGARQAEKDADKAVKAIKDSVKPAVLAYGQSLMGERKQVSVTEETAVDTAALATMMARHPELAAEFAGVWKVNKVARFTDVRKA